MKATLERLFRVTLADIDLGQVLPQRVQVEDGCLRIDKERLELDDCDRIVIAALGKAAYTMSASLVRLLEPRPVQGIAVGPPEIDCQIKGIDLIRGQHPYPDAGSLQGAGALLELMQQLGERDLVIFLLSGGGSSLAECPCDLSVSLADLGELHRLLVTGGANIVEMNVVRKHFSGIKGGRLAVAAAPARQLTLYVSDVPAGQPSAVASGPTMPDDSNIDDVMEILQRLDLVNALPPSIRQLLEAGRLRETPKADDVAFARSTWHCLLDNDIAVDTFHQHALNEGWVVETDCTVDDWPLPDAVNTLLRHLETLATANPGCTVCLVSGGELSCPVTGNGAGGRNQAFVLRAAQQIANTDITVLSAGTDGIDGNSPAAGAVANGDTIGRANSAGLAAGDYETRSDSYNFFNRLGDIIVTGPTGNNVRDLRMLVNKQES